MKKKQEKEEREEEKKKQTEKEEKEDKSLEEDDYSQQSAQSPWSEGEAGLTEREGGQQEKKMITTQFFHLGDNTIQTQRRREKSPNGAAVIRNCVGSMNKRSFDPELPFELITLSCSQRTYIMTTLFRRP